MWPDQVSNPGPLTFKSGALPTALHGLAFLVVKLLVKILRILSMHPQSDTVFQRETTWVTVPISKMWPPVD